MTQNQRHQKALEAAYRLGLLTGYGKDYALGFKEGKRVTTAQLEAAYDEGYKEGSDDQAAIGEVTEPGQTDFTAALHELGRIAAKTKGLEARLSGTLDELIELLHREDAIKNELVAQLA